MGDESSSSLLMGLEKILKCQGIRWAIHQAFSWKGEKLSMWHDNWHPEGVLIPNFVKNGVYDTAISEFEKVSNILKEIQ